MRTFRSKGSTTGRPFFTDDEMERTATEELRAVELLPASPQAIRVERFVEKRFGKCIQYEPLDRGILGYTLFGPKGVQAIIVSRALSEEGTRVAERRINTTIAHEAGHGLLHAYLFVLDSFPISLFENAADVTSTRILCRDERRSPEGRQRYDGRWWEFQANRMMSALLMPRELVHACLQSIVTREGQMGMEVLPDGARQNAILLLANVFDVNPIVAQIRLQGLYPANGRGQLTL